MFVSYTRLQNARYNTALQAKAKPNTENPFSKMSFKKYRKGGVGGGISGYRYVLTAIKNRILYFKPRLSYCENSKL